LVVAREARAERRCGMLRGGMGSSVGPVYRRDLNEALGFAVGLGPIEAPAMKFGCGGAGRNDRSGGNSSRLPSAASGATSGRRGRKGQHPRSQVCHLSAVVSLRCRALTTRPTDQLSFSGRTVTTPLGASFASHSIVTRRPPPGMDLLLPTPLSVGTSGGPQALPIRPKVFERNASLRALTAFPGVVTPARSWP